MKNVLYPVLMSAIGMGGFCGNEATAQIITESPLSAKELTRLELVAKQAKDAQDITESEYRSTIAALHSNPCKGVDRTFTNAQKAALTPVIASQQGWKTVKLNQSFRLGKWQIIYLENGVSDDPYIFYPDSPRNAKSLGMWGGAATIFETAEILNWTIQNIPGIPNRLARCFAWHVTFNRD